MPKRPVILLLLYKYIVRKCLLILLQLAFVATAGAQNSTQLKTNDKYTDSLQLLLIHAKEDTAKVNLMIQMARGMKYDNLDSQKNLLEKALQLSRQSGYQRGEMKSNYFLSSLLTLSGNYPAALELLLKALDISKGIKDKDWTAMITDYIGLLYLNLGDYRQGLQYSFKARKMFSSTDDLSLANNSLNIGYEYLKLNKLDSALIYLNECYQLSSKATAQSKVRGRYIMGYGLQSLGDVWSLKGNNNLAEPYYRKAINIAKEISDLMLLSYSYLGLAQMFNKISLRDSAFKYAAATIASSVEANNKIEANVLMSHLFESIDNSDSALRYYKVAMTTRDSTFNKEKIKQIQNLQFAETLREQQIEQARKETQQRYENEIKIYSLIGGLILLLSLAFFLYRNNQQKRKAYTLLQKQNAQAQMEAALERVRAQAMAMRNSNDVSNAIGLLFTELDKLGIVTIRCGIIIIEEATETMEVWTAIPTAEGRVAQISGRVDANIHPLLENGFQAWRQKKRFYSYELVGNDVLNYYKAITTNAPQYSLPVTNNNTERQICSVFFFKEGAVFTFTSHPLAAETRLVLEKFAAVFGLTYRRYLDLKVAEEQTQLAVKQASLDRVRAEIASMRSTDDLQRITPLIWRELHTLHVPFVRCGVFIVDEDNQITHAYLSTPKGQVLGVLNVHIEEDAFTRSIVEHWRKGLVYMEHWDKEQFISWMQTMIDLKQIQNKELYQGEAHPPESLCLHFVPFTQGMLYVGNSSLLTAAEIQLVKSLAEAFAIAYARYEDFKQLEAAKNKVEATLHELKTTQRQLVQKEKMASLGELTAGVAHEIQNPLNFVNNFSEVSAELLTEMKEALKKDDKQEAIAVADNLVTNLQKISFHGKRADAIVRGMLQHSRKNTGEKEPTDINALADEYLRLSYQGIRAKDKNFNAVLETHFDESIGKINIVPQDMSRVLLNLFNNTFYAVNEKKKLLNGVFEPSVIISTKKENDKAVTITVKDNGNGVPQQVMDKIFQPFFTTKPTGQGTGLGLSLSYDIIKAHGGEIKVDSKEGEGTHFIIQLPV